MISDQEMMELIKKAAEEGEFDRMSLEQMERIYNEGSSILKRGIVDDDLARALDKFMDAIEKRKSKNTAPVTANASAFSMSSRSSNPSMTASPDISVNSEDNEDESYNFSFEGNGKTLFGIQIVNLLLIIVTLGIYYFWAKVRVRAYMWSQTDFNGDRFQYHGTAQEVLKGWLKALVVFGVPFWVCQNVPSLVGATTSIIAIGAILSMIIIGIFFPVAAVGSRRYRLSRTSLRGIRFSFRGSWKEFLKILSSCGLWLVLTIGLYKPYFDMRTQSFMINNAYFGNKKFGFNGNGNDIFGKFFLAVLLAIPTLYISFAWYSYTKTKYIWDHTTFGTARFQSSITFGGYFGLYFVNALILIFTLGFGLPWVRVRTMNYYLENLTLKGQVDLSAIVQDAQDSSAFGEEVGDFLDMDFEMG